MSPEETLSQPEFLGDLGALDAPVASGIECPACGTQNTTDSKFCRHCGQLLRSLASGAPTDAKKAVAISEVEDDEEMTSPAKIDERRAHGLLDRALAHSERGDLNAAILACRQAIALDHNHAEPYALLGTLLERNGDLRGAMGAYERVVEIAPDNELERDSLNRLKARLDKAPPFNFNPDELFPSSEVLPSVAVPVIGGEILSEEVPVGIDARLPPTSSSLQTPEATPVVEKPADDLVFDFDPTPENATPSVSPLAAAMDGETVSRVGMPVAPSPVPASTSTGVPNIERRHEERRQVTLPVATNRRVVSDRRASLPKTVGFQSPAWPTPSTSLPRTTAPAAVPIIAPLDFSFGATPTPPTPLWARFMRDSSFFVRALPVVAVAVLGLGFLGWARSQAVAGDANTVPAQIDDTTIVQTPPGTQPVQPTGVSVVPTPGAGDGFAITNATPVPNPPSVISSSVGTNNQAPVSVPPANNSNSSSAVPSSNTNAGRQNTTAPSFPRPLPPAAVPPPSATNTNSGNGGNSGGGNTLILPPPQTGAGDAPQPRIRVGGSVPLNPAGSPSEGRIRITQGNLGGGRSVAPPPRTGSVARGEERNASAAGANGNSDRVINSLTNALNASGSDQGYLLQQRAMAFMDRGDYGRAADDFQSAMDAYQNQINNGENVAAAQAGLRAARSGLNLAQAQR